MVPAHVQTIPGELLQLLSEASPDPFGRLQYRADVVFPLAVE
jgi:hypothetical protein